jgi:AhpD family alkylhydroperoxidase
MSEKEKFQKERDRLNETVMQYGTIETKRFFSLDHQMYETGRLDEKTKEMLGLVSSLVLRCDDCIFYHLIRCWENGTNSQEIMEVLNIGLVVGGSIVIPHLRRALKRWDELLEEELPFATQFDQIVKLIGQESDRDSFSYLIADYLKCHNRIFDWVGFYWLDPEKKDELVLGSFSGAPTEHVRIPVGKGICGMAAQDRNTFVVQDVRLESNYLSCNQKVRSEIVIPIFKDNIIIGELDIDSHTLSPFSEDHKAFLERIAQIVGDRH